MYKRYEKYKDSGIEWIGEVPEYWVMGKIKRTAKRGLKTFIDGDWIETPFITIEGIRLIQTGNIGIGYYKEQGYRYISEKTFDDLNCTEVIPGDVLICRLAGPVGRACLAPSLSQRMITSVDVCILKPSDNIDRRYLVYYFSCDGYLESIDIISRGGTRQRISRSQLGNHYCIVPSYYEQKTIANFLDHKTSEIDSLIADKEELIKKLEEYKQSIITEAVTKGLNPDVKMKDSGIEWIGEIPEHWDYFALKRLAVFRSGETINSESIEPEGEYPVYGGNGLRGYTSDYTNEGHYILIGRQGALCGNINYANGLFWASEHAVVVYHTKNTAIKWFGELLRSMNLNQYSVSAAQPGLSVNNIVNLRIPVPPKEEQYDIANYIDSSLCDIDTLVEFVNDAINKLKTYRQSLIYEAVTGKIDVRDYQSERSEQLA